MYKYTDALQITMVIFTTLLVGAIFGFIKFFTPENMKRVRRLLYMIPIATMMFYEIATAPFTVQTWLTFVHAIIIQAILHILALVYCAIFHGKKSVMEKFTEISIAFTESDFFWYGYPFSQILFTQDFNHYSAMAMFVQTLLVHSAHMILVLIYVPDAEKSFNKMSDPVDEDTVPLEPKQHAEKEAEEHSDKVELPDIPKDEEKSEHSVDNHGLPKKAANHNDNVDAKDAKDSEKPEEKKTEENKQNSSSQEEKKTDENSTDKENSSSGHEVNVESGKDEEQKPADVAESDQKPEKKWYYPKWLIIMYAFVNQHNICAIIGLFWSLGVSFTHLVMWNFLESFTFDLEKASICAGLFVAGTFIAFHPFKGAPIVDVIFACIFHFIIKPLLAIAFGYALGLDHDIARFLTIVNIAPVSMYGYQLSDQAGWKTSAVTYGMYWTMILVLPVYLIWLAIIKAVNLFA